MRGWLAVNLFLIAMILVAAGLLYLALFSIRALGVSPQTERVLMGFAGIAAIVAAGIFGKRLLATLEKRSRG